jgi:alanine-alpha-ketoisovalerate/valine-pyruvate aminotransferase
MRFVEGTPEEVAAYIKLMNIQDVISTPVLPQQEKPKAKSIVQETTHHNPESLGKDEMEVYKALLEHAVPINSNLLYQEMKRKGTTLDKGQVSSTLSRLYLHKKYVDREGNTKPYSYFIKETVDGN